MTSNSAAKPRQLAWSDLQRHCLAQLGVPVYQFKPVDDASAELTTNLGNVSRDGALDERVQSSFYYKLGPWYLAFSKQLPVEGLHWLRDLAAYCADRPSEVAPIDSALLVDEFAMNDLSPEQKKRLWKLLKADLRVAKP